MPEFGIHHFCRSLFTNVNCFVAETRRERKKEREHWTDEWKKVDVESVKDQRKGNKESFLGMKRVNYADG